MKETQSWPASDLPFRLSQARRLGERRFTDYVLYADKDGSAV
jgi:hypothetical protein